MKKKKSINLNPVSLPKAMAGREYKEAKDAARRHGMSINEYFALQRRTEAENK